MLQYWVLGLPAYSVYMYMYNTFASMRRFLPFALLNCALVVVQVALYALLSSSNVLGILGIPVSDLIYYTLGSICAIVLLWRMVGKIDVASITVLMLKVLIATVVGVVFVSIIQVNIFAFDLSALYSLIQLIVMGIVGLIIIFGLCALLRVDEMDILKGILNRFRRR